MEPLSLTDKNLAPTPDVLQATLQDSFPAYMQLERELKENGTIIEWRYYNDGKAWLGKLLNKKNNLGWLHAYNGSFTVRCFFMEKHKETVAQSEIPAQYKEAFLQETFDSKLKPIYITVHSTEQTRDVHKLINLKKQLK